MLVNLERLDRLCKGDVVKKQRYLLRFLELVPPAVERIRADLQTGDGQEIRKSVHFLAPQMVFFGIDDFAQILERIDAQPDGVNLPDLHQAIQQAIDKAREATTEVENMVIDLRPKSSS